jgi:photosystem II stability/assembly factor-like uncharacterized protein
MPEITQSGFSRVWLILNGANPANVPSYQGLMKIGDPTAAKGSITRVEIPDPGRYDNFLEVAGIKGKVERPKFPLTGRYPMDVSTLLKLANQGCPLDVQVHLGKCNDPRDFNKGWQKIMIFENARITDYKLSNFGALGSDDRKLTDEEASLESKNQYEVAPLSFEEEATVAVTREIISIDVCDQVGCGDCGIQSDGCQKVLATQLGVGSTPGAPAGVIYSTDGGATWGSTNISTLLGNEAPSDSECLGANFVVTSMVDEAWHIAATNDILLGVPSWRRVNAGIVFGKGPNAVTSAGPQSTWMVGQGGYIYFISDPNVGAVVQEAGINTTQNLNDVDALDEFNVLAVGNSNVVEYTDNGGDSWRLITGPLAGMTSLHCKMLDRGTWLIGGSSAGGLTAVLFYTNDFGNTWTAIPLPINGAKVTDIKFATKSVGYLSLTVTGAYPRILRTLDGGHSWYVLPEGAGAFPNTAAQRINQIAVCADPNIVWGVGLGAATDGIIVKAS